jgi:hypothetical protein
MKYLASRQFIWEIQAQTAGAAQADKAVDDDDVSGIVHHDRCEGGVSCSVYNFPDGGRRSIAMPVPRHPRKDRPDWRDYQMYGIK